MAEFFGRKENQKDGEIAAYKIEVPPVCKGVAQVTDSDCKWAYIHWMDAIPKDKVHA